MAAKEKSNVATVDIPGEFLQTKTSDKTFINLQGAIVESLLNINPQWKQYVMYEGRKRLRTTYSEALERCTKQLI